MDLDRGLAIPGLWVESEFVLTSTMCYFKGKKHKYQVVCRSMFCLSSFVVAPKRR